MKKVHLAFVLSAVVAAWAAQPAMAEVVTSIPGGTVVPMPAVNYFGPGPETFGPGITWSSTNAANQGGSVFGYTGGYGFAGNGSWDGALGPMAGVNDSFDAWGVTDTMTFALSTPVSAIGGFINYVPGDSTPTTIAVYTPGGALIESYSLTFLTGGGTDTGQFLGFSESSPSIGYFTLTDNYIGIVNLTIASSSVPEPGSMALMGIGVVGFGGFGWLRRRARKNAAV